MSQVNGKTGPSTGTKAGPGRPTGTKAEEAVPVTQESSVTSSGEPDPRKPAKKLALKESVASTRSTRSVKTAAAPSGSKKGVKRTFSKVDTASASSPSKKADTITTPAVEDTAAIPSGSKGVKRTLSKVDAVTVNSPSKKANKGKKPSPAIQEIQDLPEGEVLTLGLGEMGQLGLGTGKLTRKMPCLVEGIDEAIVEICAGGVHTACRGKSGDVYTFGCNDDGALGRPTDEEEDNFIPGKVDLPGKAVAISCGDSHTVVLLENGKVYAWGTFHGSNGKMGLTAPDVHALTPVPILPGTRVVKIGSGCHHVVMLTVEGDVFTFGRAEQGQLGRISERFAASGVRKNTNRLLEPSAVPFPRALGKNILIDDIWAGYWATFARKKDSDVIYAFGLNNFSQLGVPGNETQFFPVKSQFSGVTQIAVGQHHTIVLDKKGAVYSVGSSLYGALGLGAAVTDDVEVPTRVQSLDGSEVVSVSAGMQVSYALSSTGKAYVWGANTNQQLGVDPKDPTDKWLPQPMGGQQIANRKILAVSCGGQHGAILATLSSGDDAPS